MSGPKVVRIVTREELVAICQGHLCELDAAVSRWQRACGEASDEDISEQRRRRDRIASLLETDSFTELRRAAPAAIAFLADDAERRQKRAAKRRAQLRTSARKTRTTAASLLASLEAQGCGADAPFIHDLRVLAKGGEVDRDKVGQTLHEAVSMLADSGGAVSGLSEEQRRLAAALDDGGEIQTLNDWLAAQPDPMQALGERVDRYIARLETAFDSETAEPFATRWIAILDVEDLTQRRMLADTLVIDLATEEHRLKSKGAALAELEALSAQLEPYLDEDVTEVREVIAVAMDSEEPTKMVHAAELARGTLEEARRHMAAKARRAALLTQLSRQGYEIREGMETGLVESGRIVVSTPHARDYGVEVASAGERFQLRAVRFADPGSATNPSRDREMETIWCDDFAQIREAVAAEGGEILIDAGRAPGEVAVKQVILTTPSGDDEVDIPRHGKQRAT